MKRFIIIFLILIAFSIYNFPIIYYKIYNNDPCNNPYEITLNGKILFISDVHLKGNENYSFLASFMKRKNINNLVIVGDLHYSKDVILKDEDILAAFGLKDTNTSIIFVRGNHDPNFFNSKEILFVGECAKISIDNITIYATHGHYSSRIGFVGGILNLLGIDFELLWKKVMKIDDWVVFGHFHLPKIDYNNRYARCGGWIDRLILSKNPVAILYSDGNFTTVNYSTLISKVS